MPLSKFEKINANSFWCLWEITESFEQLYQKVVLSEHGKREIGSISHPIKQRERLAARCCLHELVSQTGK